MEAVINARECAGTFRRSTKLGVICYGLGDLASQFIWTFVGSYLTIFYTDVVGFTPAVVFAIMMIARIWDAVNDPMMGSIAENSRSRFGRFRPWIAFGCPFLAVFAVLTFANMGNSRSGIIFSALIYIAAGMLYTLVNIPYSSLAAVMTEDPKQRTLIGTSRSVGMNIGMIIVNSCSASLALYFSGSGAEVATGHGYMMTAIVYSIIAVPLFLIVFVTSKEVIASSGAPRKISPGATLKGMVSNKYLMTIFAVSTLQMIGFMGRISITTYYAIYCLGAFTLIALIMTIPSIGGVIGSLLIAPIASRIGKRNALALTLFGQALGLLIIYLAPFDNMTLVMTGHWIYGIFNCGFPLMLAMVADCVDYQQDVSGIRMDGSYYAVYGLSTKFGNALGSSFGVMILAAFGYAANQEQTAAAKAGINFTVNLLPCIAMVAAAVILLLLWNKSDADFDAIRMNIHKKAADDLSAAG
jgi:sugar (glycoside-pentoside-hexuronide) transporter